MCVCTFRHAHLCACAPFGFVREHLCTDLYQNFFGSPLLCYKLKFQISLRSNVPLLRYLQKIESCIFFVRYCRSFGVVWFDWFSFAGLIW